jgi:hypothetical protein
MQVKRFARPTVEALESRWAPALLLTLDTSGNLTGIFGVPDGDVTVTFTADDTVNIDEDLNDLGTYVVSGGTLTVNIGNTIEALTHTINLGAFDLSGDLRVTLGNASDVTTLDITGTAAAAIEGNLRVVTGNGEDEITLSSLTVEGSAYFKTQGSVDSLLLDGATIRGNLTVADVQDFEFDSGSLLDGNLSFSSRTENRPTTIDLDGEILGLASINTGNANDVVNVRGTINSHAIFKLANGNNNLDFFSSAIILGDVVVQTGSGNDDVDFLAAIIGGRITLTTGAGNDDVSFAGTEVLGSGITYVAGNGNDILTITGLSAPGARLMFQGQNGNDNVTFAGAIDLLSAYLDGGFGLNNFTGGPVGFPITLRNFV